MRRVFAQIIDCVVLVGIAVPIYVGHFVLAWEGHDSSMMSEILSWAKCAAPVLYSAVEPAANWSVGKWLCGMEVRDLAGAPLRPAQKWLRWAVKYSPLWVTSLLLQKQIAEHLNFTVATVMLLGTLAIILIDTVFVLAPPPRTLHDWLARTTVARTDSGAAKRPMQRGFPMDPLPICKSPPNRRR